MLLTEAHITLFKSIDDSEKVSIDPHVTILVGQNESGKTAFLKALHKAVPVEKNITYDVVEDYPRKRLSLYEREHLKKPATVAKFTYQLDDKDIDIINEDLGFALVDKLSFTVSHKYDNITTFGLHLDEKKYIEHLLENASLDPDVIGKVSKAENLKELINLLESLDLNPETKKILGGVKTKIQ